MTARTRIMASIIFTLTILLFFMIVRSFFVFTFKLDIVLIGDNPLILPLDEEYVELGYYIKPEKESILSKITTENNIDTSKVGEYEVIYTYKANDRTIKKTRKIIVKDTTPPVLKIDSSKDLYTVKGVELNTPKCSAMDNYDGDITKKVIINSNVDFEKVGLYQIDYKVTDASGNETKETINVHVEESKRAYIEVAIKKQKLYYYEFSSLVLESDVVTGYADATPYGTFSVINKARNVVLRGRDYASFVEYWIDFKDHAYGFHDASWRSSFGGEIYLRNGSHGCVNMPKDKVKELYDLVPIGTPVYIHS